MAEQLKHADAVLARARMFLFVREVPAGSNAGKWVEAIQRIGGTVKGQPWCAAFVCSILGLWYDNRPPFGYTASCDDILAWARKNGKIVERPLPGDLFLHMKSTNDATHVGFVSAVGAERMGTIEGNSSDPEAPPTREGFGVFERTSAHIRSRKWRDPSYVFVRYLELTNSP